MFEKNTMEVIRPSQCVMSGVMRDVNLDYLVRSVYWGFLHCEVTIFSFRINAYLGSNIL